MLWVRGVFVGLKARELYQFGEESVGINVVVVMRVGGRRWSCGDRNSGAAARVLKR